MQLTKKVNESLITEAVYRALKQKINYSSCKLFVDSRKRFFNEIVLGQAREDKGSVATTLGSLIHAILADQFDEKFSLSQCVAPVGQVLELTEELFRITTKSMDENGVQTQRFEVLFEEAFNRVKYDYNGQEIAFKGKTLEKAVEMFTTPDKKTGASGEMYYNELLTLIGKQVVSIPTITHAEKLVDKLKSHPATRDIVNLQSSESKEVFNEIPILFSIDGVEFRALLDKLVVDHISKEILPYDYKCTFDSESDGFGYSYTKNMYYLQVAIYDKAVKHFKREHNLDEYTVRGMQYVVIDTTGFNDPVIYQCSEKDIINGWEGFRIGYKKYPGATEIISDISYHLGTGVWSAPRESQEKNGILPLSIEYR